VTVKVCETKVKSLLKLLILVKFTGEKQLELFCFLKEKCALCECHCFEREHFVTEDQREYSVRML